MTETHRVPASPNETGPGPAPIEMVLAEVKDALAEVIGEEYLADVEIHMETSFESDLEIESVEFVALAELLRDRYPSVDFVAWVAEMEVTELMGLRIGQLVQFIARSLEAPAPA